MAFSYIVIEKNKNVRSTLGVWEEWRPENHPLSFSILVRATLKPGFPNAQPWI